MSEFLPTSWTVPSLSAPYSALAFPLASAMKLLRVVATSGRHACARLVCWEVLSVTVHLIQVIYFGKPVFPSQLNSFGVIERLSHLLSAEPGELLLEKSEAIRITTEAYRLWAVAAGYGQACKLYTSVNTYKLAARS